LLKGVQKKRAKSTFGGLSPLDQMPVENYFVEEALCEVFSTFIVVAGFAKIAVDRLPVTFEQ
jgi:hypothetical protein